MKPIIRYVCLFAVCTIMMLAATDLWACPTCKDGIAENDPISQSTAAGYYYSILFMMAMPFVIIGTFGSAAYFSIRRAQLNTENAETQRAAEK